MRPLCTRTGNNQQQHVPTTPKNTLFPPKPDPKPSPPRPPRSPPTPGLEPATPRPAAAPRPTAGTGRHHAPPPRSYWPPAPRPPRSHWSVRRRPGGKLQLPAPRAAPRLPPTNPDRGGTSSRRHCATAPPPKSLYGQRGGAWRDVTRGGADARGLPGRAKRWPRACPRLCALLPCYFLLLFFPKFSYFFLFFLNVFHPNQAPGARSPKPWGFGVEPSALLHPQAGFPAVDPWGNSGALLFLQIVQVFASEVYWCKATF